MRNKRQPKRLIMGIDINLHGLGVGLYGRGICEAHYVPGDPSKGGRISPAYQAHLAGQLKRFKSYKIWGAVIETMQVDNRTHGQAGAADLLEVAFLGGEVAAVARKIISKPKRLIKAPAGLHTQGVPKRVRIVRAVSRSGVSVAELLHMPPNYSSTRIVGKAVDAVDAFALAMWGSDTLTGAAPTRTVEPKLYGSLK